MDLGSSVQPSSLKVDYSYVDVQLSVGDNELSQWYFLGRKISLRSVSQEGCENCDQANAT
jgi:hypothetical protein